MEKIIFGILFISSTIFANWQQELDIHKGYMNTLSIKSLCTHPNKEKLAEEILEFFKKQDEVYYHKHKDAIDDLPMKLIESTREAVCPSGYTVVGECGSWVCTENIN